MQSINSSSKVEEPDFDSSEEEPAGITRPQRLVRTDKVVSRTEVKRQKLKAMAQDII